MYTSSTGRGLLVHISSYISAKSCQLISDQTLYLRAHSIYPCLLFDTMFMGLYHAYRILCVDNKMEKQERKKLACSLLTRNFQLPNRIICSTSYLRFLAIYIFYSLPITIKINLVNLAIKFKIKDILQKWFHFN